MLDPIGFTFEHYDPIGRWRDTDNGKPVDTTGQIAGTDVEGPAAMRWSWPAGWPW